MGLEDLTGHHCAMCGTPFEAKSIAHRYCCESCRVRAGTARLVEKIRAKARAKNTACTCPRCGKVFDATHGRQKFCARACTAVTANDRRRGKPLATALAALRCQTCNGPLPDAVITTTMFCRPCKAVRKKVQHREACQRWRARERILKAEPLRYGPVTAK